MEIVLVEPEIPPNTGSIARLCAATGSGLHLIEPLGFRLDDATLRRAGMDYWRLVRWRRWPDWKAFLTGAWEPAQAAARESGRTPPGLWFVESGGPRRYDQARFGPDDFLVFGRETAGLPPPLLEAHRDRWLRLPMFQPEARSLNLSHCVAVVLYEALRQQGFPGERPG
ncbi:MAG: tRNA (cytidine(34)-2'-O)-methyltransferase [Verrucomicrobia bacterium]|nr:MAG: tRNA (cytidine(34)-2'-O)-methyltransferase [Verrucomicrobiota bacterium]